MSDTRRGRGSGSLSQPAQATHSIGIRELRQHASVYVDLVEKGQTVDITNRGRLVAAGIIQPAEDPGSLLDIEPAPPVPQGQPTASEILLQMREEERY